MKAILYPAEHHNRVLLSPRIGCFRILEQVVNILKLGVFVR